MNDDGMGCGRQSLMSGELPGWESGRGRMATKRRPVTIVVPCAVA